MSTSYVPRWLREQVAADADHRCGYCQTAEAVVGTPMEIDHIIPRSLGGATLRENLWLACGLCNEHKGSRTTAFDPMTGESTALFHPRHQRWPEHFSWVEEGAILSGQTPCGRATVLALQMNRASLVRARRSWIAVGWHPPR